MIAFILLFFVSFSTSFAIPKVKFENGAFPFMSTFCENDDFDYDKLELARAEIEGLWKDLKGEDLLKEVVKIFNKDFSENEIKATIIACKNKPSISLPLLINIQTTDIELNDNFQVWALRTIFHEILHTYIVDNFDCWGLIKNYGFENENRVTKNHICLMAIEQCVYKRKGLVNYLKIAESAYKKWPDYFRAWTIVNEKGCEKLIKEMNKFKF